MSGFCFFTTYVFSGKNMMSTFPRFHYNSYPRVNGSFIICRRATFTVEDSIVVARTNVRSAFFRDFCLVVCFLAGSVYFVRTVRSGRRNFRSFLGSLCVICSIFLFPFSHRTTRFSSGIGFIHDLCVSSGSGGAGGAFDGGYRGGVRSLRYMLRKGRNRRRWSTCDGQEGGLACRQPRIPPRDRPMRLPVALRRISDRHHCSAAHCYYGYTRMRGSRRCSHRVRDEQRRTTSRGTPYIAYYLGSEAQ